MKKKILYTALTASFLFSFAGCKKKSDITTPGKYWHYEYGDYPTPW